MEYCIYENGDDYKAKMVVDILEKNKIPTYSINMTSDLRTSNIKICVKEEDVKKATQIINQLPFLKNDFKTIADDKSKKDAYIIQRSIYSSFLSFFIIPFFFNIEHIIYHFKNNLKTKYILLIANVLCLLFSIVLCISDLESIKFIWKWNLLFTPAFSIEKFIDLHKKESMLKYLMFIPIILLILSYNIADRMFGIRLF